MQLKLRWPGDQRSLQGSGVNPLVPLLPCSHGSCRCTLWDDLGSGDKLPRRAWQDPWSSSKLYGLFRCQSWAKRSVTWYLSHIAGRKAALWFSAEKQR